MSSGRKSIAALGLLLSLAILCTSVQAHQRKEAYVTVLFNTKSGYLEVSHRFLLHDLNHALQRHFAVRGDLSTDAEAQSFFATYLQSRFSLSSENKPLALNTIGFEVEGKYFWLYQERPLEDYKQLTVEHTALHEIWPKQVNHINFERAAQTRSARLSVDKPKASVDLTMAKTSTKSQTVY